jgi:hypothetical protein
VDAFATVALAWLGMYVHNVADLPNLTLSSPENLLPGLVWLLLLFALWSAMPGRSWPLILLRAWGMLNPVRRCRDGAAASGAAG